MQGTHIFFTVAINDDIILLCRSKRQCAKAKRALKNILHQLKLRLAPTKTKIGLIDNGFHFLGMNFEVAQTPQKVHTTQNNEDTLTTHKDRTEQPAYQEVRVSLHPQSYHRSIDQWKIRREGVGNPTEAQIYLRPMGEVVGTCSPPNTIQRSIGSVAISVKARAPRNHVSERR